MTDAVREDAELVRLAARGDSAAWRTLTTVHSVPLYRYAWRIVGERDAAEDVVQETFLRLWRHADRWRPDAPVRAWLYRVAGNVARDMLRSRRDVVELEADKPDPAPSVVDQVVADRRAAQVRALVDQLPERQRHALILCRWEGLSMAEAATVMDCTAEAVEALLSRGRRALRAGLEAMVLEGQAEVDERRTA